jgi:MFS transporter, DHA1 family, inner membrane transport protein
VMSSFSIASVAGVPIGLWIANTFDWHWSFFFIVILSSVFWVLALLMIPSIKSLAEPKTLAQKFKNLKHVLSQKDYVLSFIFTSILSFGMFIVVPFIAPYMVRTVGLTEAQLPLIYLFGGAATIFSARLIGKMCDKYGSFTVFRITATISLFAMYFITNLRPNPIWYCLLVSTFFTMTGSGRFIPAMTMISAVVKPHERGTFMSLENSFRQFSSGAASQAAGLIIITTSAGELLRYDWVGYVAITTTLLSILIAIKIRNRFHLR